MFNNKVPAIAANFESNSIVCASNNFQDPYLLIFELISRPHKFNIVNIRRLTILLIVCGRVLTVFRKTGNHFINTRCIDLAIIYTWLIQAGRANTGIVAYTGRYDGYWHIGLYRQVWRIVAQWLIHAGMADTGTMAYTGRYGGYYHSGFYRHVWLILTRLYRQVWLSILTIL